MQKNRMKELFRNPILRMIVAIFLGAFASVMDVIFSYAR